MGEVNCCQRCGRQLPQGDALGGRCPHCMLELGFESGAGNAEDFESNVNPASGDDPGSASRPRVIGRYRILRLIGEGGMGFVYEAEQSQPRRTVALKIIKPGMASPELLRRFEQESQALGRLQHPGIAQIHEAGTVDTGFGPQPYFAMEMIRGLSPRDYAETHRLNLRERLEIMAKICEAVHHAHQRGLIHRDLKPANILIDETGQPKILDFGVARVTDSDTRATVQTDLGQLIGTLAYMSPEQVLADPLDIDTRSDVYSLGVILYEFLSGRLPYAISKKLHENIQTIREADPAKLSSVNRTFRGDIENIVAKALEKDRARRYASAEAMAADIRRYLRDEPIVARPPSATYQLKKFTRRHKALVSGVAAVFVVLAAGVVAFALQFGRARYAEQAAVMARDHAVSAEVKARQQLDRALRAEQDATSERNRALSAEQFAEGAKNRAIVEIQRTAEAAGTAKALNDFLRDDLLMVADPRKQLQSGQTDLKPNPDLTVREALDRAAARIAGRFDTQPLVEAALRETIAATYISLGLGTAAQPQLERAIELRKKVHREEHPDTMKDMEKLAVLNRTLDSTEKSINAYEALMKKIVDIKSRTLGEDNPETLANMEALAKSYTGHKDSEAEALLIKIIDLKSRTLGETDISTVTSMTALIDFYERKGKSEQAKMLSDRLEVIFHTLGEESPTTQAGLSQLFGIYYNIHSKYPQAEAFIIRRLNYDTRFRSDADYVTRLDMLFLIETYDQQGKKDQADKLSAKFEARLRLLGEENPQFNLESNSFENVTGRRIGTSSERALPRLGGENLDDLEVLSGTASNYSRQGRYPEAESIWARTLEVSVRLNGKDHPETKSIMRCLGSVYYEEGKYDESEKVLKAVLEMDRRNTGPESFFTRFTMELLGRVTAKNGNWKESEELYTQLLKIERQPGSGLQERSQEQQLLLTISLLGWTQIHQQKYIEAEKILREALAFEKTQPEDWNRYNSMGGLGASLEGQKRYVEAEPLLLSAYDGITTKQCGAGDINGWDILDCASLKEESGTRIVQLYKNWGKPEKAAQWQEKLRIAKAPVVSHKPQP